MGALRKKLGVFYGLVSSGAFGLIPLFTLPLLAAGVPVQTALVYRFGISAFVLWLVLLWKRENLRVGWNAFLRVTALSVFYMFAVYFYFHALEFLPSGVVATIQFQFPVIVVLIMVLFFHEPFRWQTGVAVIMAVGGVAFLSLNPADEAVVSQESAGKMLTGVALSIASGFCNALYFVGLQVVRLPKINGLTMTFYVMLASSVFCILNAAFANSFVFISGGREICLVLLLALVTAVISNMTLILAVRLVGSTLASILGVMEPLTAVAAGCVAFGEPLTARLASGSILIIAAVILALNARPNRPRQN